MQTRISLSSRMRYSRLRSLTPAPLRCLEATTSNASRCIGISSAANAMLVAGPRNPDALGNSVIVRLEVMLLF